MTVDDALKIIAQERLDALAEGMTAEEARDIAAYVLHDAVLKDRKYISLLQDLRMQEQTDPFASMTHFNKWIEREWPRATGYERDLFLFVWNAALNESLSPRE